MTTSPERLHESDYALFCVFPAHLCVRSCLHAWVGVEQIHVIYMIDKHPLAAIWSQRSTRTRCRTHPFLLVLSIVTQILRLTAARWRRQHVGGGQHLFKGDAVESSPDLHLHNAALSQNSFSWVSLTRRCKDVPKKRFRTIIKVIFLQHTDETDEFYIVFGFFSEVKYITGCDSVFLQC